MISEPERRPDAVLGYLEDKESILMAYKKRSEELQV